MWLDGQGVRGRIRAALGRVLMQLWQAAWKAGAEAAGEAAGHFESVPDQVVADRVSRMAAQWIDEVTDTRMRRIAAILAKGGSAAELEAAVKAVLESESDADLIARTEVMRAMQLAALDVYRAAQVQKVRWVTHSANPCPVCIANEAAGPRWLGEPFPSGDVAPPAHPNCQCALVPAENE